MKQSKFLLPVFMAVIFMMEACIPAPSEPELDDADEIIEEIRSKVSDRIAENVQLKIDELSSSLNDTLISISEAGDTAKVSKVISRSSLPINVTIDEVTVDAMSSYYKEYYSAVRTQMRLTQVTIITIVVFSLIFLLTVAVLLFFYRRLKSRNDVIANAIEHNYQLPESFYNSSDRGWSIDLNDQDGGEMPKGDGNGAQTVPPAYRKVRNIEQGKRNIAIGLGIIIVFSVWSAPAISVIGVIPLLIGVGQLLSLKK